MVVLAGAVAAGCSNDAARFADGPLFAGSTQNQREIIAGAPAPGAAPVVGVRSSAYAPPAGAGPAAPGEVSARGYWSTRNAPIVTVGAGDSLAVLGQRHGVPLDVIMRANGLDDESSIVPGTQLVIPTYVYRDGEAAVARTAEGIRTESAGVAASASGPRPLGQLPISAEEARTTADAIAVAPAGAGGVHVVQPGETLWSVARANGVSPQALMEANGVPADYRVKAGERLAIPGAGGTAVASRPAEAAEPAAEPAREEVQVAAVASEAVRAGPVMTDAAPERAPEAAPEARADEDAAVSDGGVSGFRWPARGRIVAGFGKQPNGERNDGINLALPAGTPIKAAQGGKVIYAGNELKGYGNLILVQHEGGWVTAYAHADEMMVARGDQVRRGQVIGTVGSTGDVSQPQLHFEIRKGSKPVDPLPHLSGA